MKNVNDTLPILLDEARAMSALMNSTSRTNGIFIFIHTIETLEKATIMNE